MKPANPILCNSDRHRHPVTPGSDAAGSPPPARKSISMHDDVPVWYDCCSCEMEPYWEQAMDQDPRGPEQQDASDPD